MKITAILSILTATIAIASPVAEPAAAPEALAKREYLTQSFHIPSHYVLSVLNQGLTCLKAPAKVTAPVLLPGLAMLLVEEQPLLLAMSHAITPVMPSASETTVRWQPSGSVRWYERRM
jgi:hypothetical protein